MKFRTNCFVALLFTTLLCCTLPFLCSAQKKTDKKHDQSGKSTEKPTGPVWTKLVVREVYFADTVSTDGYVVSDGYKLLSHDEYLSFRELIANALRQKQFVAYDTTDVHFLRQLSQKQMEAKFDPKRDTIINEDPITGQVITKFIIRDFGYESICKYKILEEWSFHNSTGETGVTILGIGPVQVVYNDTGTYTGEKFLFWLKYDDVKDLFADFEQTRPGYDFNIPVWKDFFSEKQVK